MFSWSSVSWRKKSSWEMCERRPLTAWESCNFSVLKINRDIFSWRIKTKESLVAVLSFAFIALLYLALTRTPATFLPLYGSDFPQKVGSFLGLAVKDSKQELQVPKRNLSLVDILEEASMPNKTVIITTLNEAWAINNSMIDLFLESFHHGANISCLLNHLIIVAVDQKAYNRCVEIHPLCFKLKTRGVDFSGEKAFMSTDYLKMMWRRIQFLRNVLEKGYNFVFSDADILWFRNPFPHFLPDKDFQIACDQFNGNPADLNNMPNGGFVFARANNYTVKFYKYWYMSRKLYPNHHDQDVLNDIKFGKRFSQIGVKIRFLDTQFFGGFCALWRSNFDKVNTMHANCCKGLTAKLIDLRAIFDDWKLYRSNGTHVHRSSRMRLAGACSSSWHRNATI